MLFTSIFSFSHDVFKMHFLQGHLKFSLSGKEFTLSHTMLSFRMKAFENWEIRKFLFFLWCFLFYQNCILTFFLFKTILNPLTLSQMTNFRLFQTEEVSLRKFFIRWRCRKFSNWVENTMGKGEIAHYEQFLLFPQCFQKNYTTDT